MIKRKKSVKSPENYNGICYFYPGIIADDSVFYLHRTQGLSRQNTYFLVI